MRVLIVLPTYNEALNIEPMLRALRNAAPACDVLVVDDGSPDGTAQRARNLSSELGNIVVLERTIKSGIGAAYRAGFQWGIARGYERLVEMDCDFSHDPLALKALLNAATSYDVVIGSRYISGGKVPQWSISRRLLSRCGNLYASVMLSLEVTDCTSGFRVYSSETLKKIGLNTVTTSGYGFQIEMTYRARAIGASIVEVPISFVDRKHGESKMSTEIIKEALVMVTLLGVQRGFQLVLSSRNRVISWLDRLTENRG